jgi:hypothetical protein
VLEDRDWLRTNINMDEPLPEQDTTFIAADQEIDERPKTVSSSRDASTESSLNASVSTSPPSSVGDNSASANGDLSNVLSSKYPASNLQLEDRHIDQHRSLRVTVIGAGIAGITAAILLPAKVPGIQLTVLEKNNEVVSIKSRQSFLCWPWW